jgi:hypothetical protein
MTDIQEPTTTTPSMESRAGSRRWLLRAGGVAAVGAFLAACGDDDEGVSESGSAGTSTTAAAGGGDETTTTEGDSGGGGDLAIAQLAASLEVLAVNTYGAALDAATSGALGAVPPAVAEFVTTAMGQHQEHLDALNGIITGAGEDEVSTPPADLEATVNDMFGQVTDVVGAAELALMLEDIAAATYLSAIPQLTSPDSITAAGSILCVDRQHAAILRFVLGEYPIPDTFFTTEQAYTG